MAISDSHSEVFSQLLDFRRQPRSLKSVPKVHFDLGSLYPGSNHVC